LKFENIVGQIILKVKQYFQTTTKHVLPKYNKRKEKCFVVVVVVVVVLGPRRAFSQQHM
jgi:hypothetical protein